jgi:hypothetical protein
MPSFCRHGRFEQNCRICNKPEDKPAPRAASSPRAASGSGTAARRPSPGRSSAVVVKRVARAVEDGYDNELVPGLKASGDARRLADELAFATARLAELAADPPGLYAEAALAEDREEALWLAFLIAHLSPLAGADPPAAGAPAGEASGPFAAIASARTTWASGDAPGLGEGVVLGPRTSVDPRQPTRTAEAYRAWAARSGSQDAAIAGEAGWTPERRFSRLFERLALPGFTRAGRVELLISLGRLGLAEIEPAELRLGADNADAATIAAKRVFGIGDAFLLERRAADLADAAGVPLAAMDLALFNFGQPEQARATMGASAGSDPEQRARVGSALGV